MQLISKFARCRIADDVFQSGDGLLLPNISIGLGEDSRSSTCSFSVLDERLAIGAKYREISVQAGGIQIPDELKEKEKQSVAASATTAPSTGAATSSTAGAGVSLADLKPEIKAFLDVIASHEVPQPYSQEAYVTMSLTSQKFSGFADHPRKIHCSGRLCSDAAGRYQFLSTSWDAYKVKAKVSDFSPQSQDLAAVAYLKELGAYNSLLAGDLTGAIRKSASTWASLPGSPYGQPTQTMAEATKTYNERLAYYKGQGGGTAVATSPSQAPPTDPMAATPAKTTPAITETSPPVEISKKGTEIIIEMAVGYGLIWKDAITFHFIHTETKTSWDADGKQVTTFTGKSIRWLLTRVPITQSFENITLKQFTEKTVKGFNLNLKFEGAGLKYQHLSQDGQTPLELLTREALRIGFRVAEGTGKKSDTLIVEPFPRPEFTNVVIDEEILIKPAVFTDKARTSRSEQVGATASAPQTGTGEAKTAIDRQTGDINQVKVESKTGSGQAAGGGSVTGATAASVGGTVKPDPMSSSTSTGSTSAPTATTGAIASTGAPTDKNNTKKVEGPVTHLKSDGTKVVTTVTTEQKVEPEKITRTKTTKSDVTRLGSSTQTTTGVELVVVTPGKTKTTITVTAPGKAPVITTEEKNKVSAEDTKLLEQSKPETSSATPGTEAPTNVDPVTGLPNQQPGFIDLKDGRAEAQTIPDESRRVKGYEDSFVLVMNMDTLQFVPGQIVALSRRLVPDAFATEKRIGTVDHNFEAGTVTINCYTPQAQLAQGSGGGAITPDTAAPTQFAVPASAPGKFIFPIPKGATTIGDGYGPRSTRVASYRHTILDVTAPEGTPAVAMADGTVQVFPNAGGAGNMMVITHGGGYESVFMHGTPGGFIVKSGPVKQGQAIFKIGTTGGSTGPHLHLKFTLNGSYCLLSKIGLDVLKMGLPLERPNPGCNQY